MTKIKDSVGVISKCYLCAALQRGMGIPLKCSELEREAIRRGKKSSCRFVKLESGRAKVDKRR